MTTNPLATRRQHQVAEHHSPAMSAQAWCDHRNSMMARNDIEWAVDSSGHPALRDRASWQAARTKEMARQAEYDRRQYAHRLTHPIRQGQ